jgi:hypothetical protein
MKYIQLSGIKNVNLRLLISLSPFLLLYSFIAYYFQSDVFLGDEARYFAYAKNLLNGYYALPYPNTNIVNGPGYPLFLYPFMLINIPINYIRVTNGLLLFLSVFFICKSLLLFVDYKKAIIASVIYGLYFPFYTVLALSITEIFSVFLISVFQYLTIKYYRSDKLKTRYLLGAAAFLAWLALTKIIYGYVILASLLAMIALVLVHRKQKKIYLSFVKIFTLALLFCTPYLFYTYTLTGEVFYWGNPGNDAFYWMTSTDKEESGDWFSIDNVDKKVWNTDRDSVFHEQFLQNHAKVIEKVLAVPTYKQDSVFYSEAVKNFKSSPKKYFTNVIANMGRLFFNYPKTYRKMKLSTYAYLIPNMFIFFIFILLIYPLIKFYKTIPFEIKIFLLLTLIYIGGSSLVSAEFRFILPILPALTIFIAYMLSKMVKISFNQDMS